MLAKRSVLFWREKREEVSLHTVPHHHTHTHPWGAPEKEGTGLVLFNIHGEGG